MTEPTIHTFRARDGARLAYREIGAGRPLVLIHGFFSTAVVNWIRYGHAAAIAAQGYRVVMPDLRAHGSSAAPHDPHLYPPDVLADDGLQLIEQLGLTEYDLGGYSLGARTTLRMLVRGARPGRAIAAGMGLEGMLHAGSRSEHFRRILRHLGSFERGTPEWMAEAFLKTVGGDPAALLLLLDTFVDTSPQNLAAISVPTLVLAGTEDRDNGSPEELAATLPNGRYFALPGNHMSVVAKPALGAAMAEFLGAAP